MGFRENELYHQPFGQEPPCVTDTIPDPTTSANLDNPTTRDDLDNVATTVETCPT